MRYLLDTNILSPLVKNPQGSNVAKRIAEVGEDKVFTSTIVSAELRFGAYKKGSTRLIEQVRAVLSAIEIVPFDSPADESYARLRHHLEQAGTPIGPNDLLIAAQALVLGATVVTANTKEFARVPDLPVENWLD